MAILNRHRMTSNLCFVVRPSLRARSRTFIFPVRRVYDCVSLRTEIHRHNYEIIVSLIVNPRITADGKITARSSVTRTETDPHRERDADVGLTGPILVKSMSGAGRLYAHSSGRVGHVRGSTTCLALRYRPAVPESPPILP